MTTPWRRQRSSNRAARAQVIGQLVNRLLAVVRQMPRPADTTLDEVAFSYLSALAMSAIYTDEVNGNLDIRTQAELKRWLRSAIDRLVTNEMLWNGIWTSCQRELEG